MIIPARKGQLGAQIWIENVFFLKSEMCTKYMYFNSYLHTRYGLGMKYTSEFDNACRAMTVSIWYLLELTIKKSFHKNWETRQSKLFISTRQYSRWRLRFLSHFTFATHCRQLIKISTLKRRYQYLFDNITYKTTRS